MFNKNKALKLLEIAIEEFGGQRYLGEKLGVNQATVSKWYKGTIEMPEQRAIDIGKAIGWSEEKIRFFLIDNYGKRENVFKSPERLREELDRLDVATLAEINKMAAVLITEKILAQGRCGTVASVNTKTTMIALNLAQLNKLSQLVQYTAIIQGQSPDDFLYQIGIIGLLALRLLDPSNGGEWRIPEDTFDRLAQNLYQPESWQGNRPILKMPYTNFSNGDRLKAFLKSENGAFK